MESARNAGADDRIAELEAIVERMGRQLDEQGRLLAELRTTAAPPPDPATDSGVAPLPAPAKHVSRRGVLLGGVAAAGAAAAVVASAAPAAANSNGESWTLGDASNSATATTGLNVNFSGAPGLRVVNSSTTGSGIVSQAGNASGLTGGGAVVGNSAERDAILGLASGASGSSGVHGKTGTYSGGGNAPGSAGVLGEASAGYGTVGMSNQGNGVGGFSNSAAGVFAQSQSSVGVRGGSDTGIGVYGYSTDGVGGVFESPRTNLRIQTGLFARGAPTKDNFGHNVGDVVREYQGDLWYCVDLGTPGVWRKLSGINTSGALHTLPTPIRVYDSRPGTSPAVGSKTPLGAGATRVVDLTANSSGVPADAGAVLVNLLVVNAAAGNANFTVWANGAAKPQANTMVWGGTTGRFSTQSITKVDAAGLCQVSCSVQTDIVVDVVAFHR